MIRVLYGYDLPPNHISFTSRFFQQLRRNKRRLEVVNDVLYRKFYNNVWHGTHKEIVVPADPMEDIIKELHNSPMQGHLGSSDMLHELCVQHFWPTMAEKVQHFVDNCQMCIRTKPCHDKNLGPALEQIYDTCILPEDILEVDLVGELSGSNDHICIITATDVFLRYLFAVPIRTPDTTSIV